MYVILDSIVQTQIYLFISNSIKYLAKNKQLQDYICIFNIINIKFGAEYEKQIYIFHKN